VTHYYEFTLKPFYYEKKESKSFKVKQKIYCENVRRTN